MHIYHRRIMKYHGMYTLATRIMGCSWYFMEIWWNISSTLWSKHVYVYIYTCNYYRYVRCRPVRKQWQKKTTPTTGHLWVNETWKTKTIVPFDGMQIAVRRYMGMDQYLLIPFLVGWTSIYQLFWCSPGVQGFDTLPYKCSPFHDGLVKLNEV